ncbi:MAG: hypothetical protein VR64_21000 [Desulfatitalea sp. BRH_c12]|nr:MAG: hypothetical protein VR64_21000 [Desulfatitalea sp. BRH_c12]
MDTPERKVGPLDKVHLLINAVPPPGNEITTDMDAQVALIFGVGSAGITPFERLLLDKKAGDRFALPVEAGAESVFFGHLLCTFTQALGMVPPYTIHVSVQSVEEAPAQEVVRAMAQSSNGCGGTCGCGCSC